MGFSACEGGSGARLTSCWLGQRGEEMGEERGRAASEMSAEGIGGREETLAIMTRKGVVGNVRNTCTLEEGSGR